MGTEEARTMAGDVAGPPLLVGLALEAGNDVANGHVSGAALGWPLV